MSVFNHRLKTVQKLTNQTAQAFVLTTRANIEAAQFLLTQHNFNYVLPSMFADVAMPDNGVGVIFTLILVMLRQLQL